MFDKLTGLHKAAIAIVFFVGMSFGVDNRYAKQDAFASYVKSERIKELLDVLYECETKYKDSKNEFIRARCKDAEIEYKELKGE